MSRWLTGVVGLVLLAYVAGAAAERPAGVRLVEVTSSSSAASQSVLITATEPASYTTRQPDPLTVLITLRDVTAGNVVTRLRPAPDDPVTSVEVLDAVDADGDPVVQVRIRLREPTLYEVRSRRQTIQVRFARPVASGPTRAPDEAAVAPPLAGRLRPATAIVSVETAVEPHAISVTLHGNGALSPGRIHEPEHFPPRLVIEFPHLATEAVAAITSVEIDPVKQVRVVSDSRDLTRVVLDLARPVLYHIEDVGNDDRMLRVVFPRDRAIDPVARIGPDPASNAAVASSGLDADSAARIETMPARRAQPPAVVAEVSTSPTALGPTAKAAVVEPAAVEPPVSNTLPLPIDDTALRVTPSAVVAEVSASPPALLGPTASAAVVTPVAPTAAPDMQAVPVAASKATERFLPLRRSGRAAVQLSGRQVLGQEYTGELISMDFQNVDLHAVLRVFAEISGLNLVIDPSVQGEVNVALTQVPWDQAFAIILRANGLNYEVDGTVIRIASVQQLQNETTARAALAQSEANAGELVLYTRTLSYARAEDLVQLITSTTLSARGEVFTDTRTNTLIIRDLQERLESVSDLLDTLDQAQQQVEIEARIVQAGHDSARALGVQWGLTGRVSQELANTLPFSFPNRGGITGRVGAAEGQGPSGIDPRAQPAENAATVVNLGVGAPTSALGLTLGSVNGALNLDVVLSALESEGEISIISTPRIMTQNNVEAEILQGTQVPYQTVANNTVTVQFKEAALTLLVTPQITAARTIIMDVQLENSFPDFGNALGDPPIPPIVTQRARTTVQVRDGETTVIGGIYENTQTRSNRRTPVLHRIPLLGWLFRSNN